MIPRKLLEDKWRKEIKQNVSMNCKNLMIIKYGITEQWY
jgi:hypothetical protein